MQCISTVMRFQKIFYETEEVCGLAHSQVSCVKTKISTCMKIFRSSVSHHLETLYVGMPINNSQGDLIMAIRNVLLATAAIFAATSAFATDATTAVKADAKVAEVKADAKAAEVKADAKAAVKKEEAKAEVKKEEAKKEEAKH